MIATFFINPFIYNNVEKWSNIQVTLRTFTIAMIWSTLALSRKFQSFQICIEPSRTSMMKPFSKIAEIRSLFLQKSSITDTRLSSK